MVTKKLLEDMAKDLKCWDDKDKFDKEKVVSWLVEKFEASNPRFDESRFREASKFHGWEGWEQIG